MKTCITCHRKKPETAFYLKTYKRKSGTHTTRSGSCKPCTIKRNNANASYENSSSIRARNRALINSLKDAPCLDCGNRFPAVCMDFDHRDPSKKTRGVTAMIAQKTTTILAEVAKCDLVCSNCHRIRTAKLLGWKYATS